MSKFNEVNGKIADGVTDAYRKIESGVVGGYKAIENGVVGGYKKIESGAVNTFNKVSDKFIGEFFTHDGETVEEAKKAISEFPGVKLYDDAANDIYPMPLVTSDQDIVYVGRIRDDLIDEKGLTLWCCGDQIRKGAATNAVQIAQLFV